MFFTLLFTSLLGQAVPKEATQHRGCVDLSGQFEYYDGNKIQNLEIRNLGCEKMEFGRQDFSYFLTLDDQFIQLSPTTYKKSRINSEELVEEYWYEPPVPQTLQLTYFSSWIRIGTEFVIQRNTKVVDGIETQLNNVVYKRIAK